MDEMKAGEKAKMEAEIDVWRTRAIAAEDALKDIADQSLSHAQVFAIQRAADSLASIAESLAKVAAYCDFRGYHEALHGSRVTDRDF